MIPCFDPTVLSFFCDTIQTVIVCLCMCTLTFDAWLDMLSWKRIIWASMWAAQRADLFTHHSLGGAHVETKWRQMAQIQCMWAA